MALRSKWQSGVIGSLFLLGAVLVLPAASIASDLVFGPVTCQHGTGAPTVFNYSFTAAEPSRGFIFKVYNGGLKDTTYELVSLLCLNGSQNGWMSPACLWPWSVYGPLLS
jgi:hypothetical protein